MALARPQLLLVLLPLWLLTYVLVRGQFECYMEYLSPSMTPCEGNGNISISISCDVNNFTLFQNYFETLAHVGVDHGVLGLQLADVVAIEAGDPTSLTSR